MRNSRQRRNYSRDRHRPLFAVLESSPYPLCWFVHAICADSVKNMHYNVIIATIDLPFTDHVLANLFEPVTKKEILYDYRFTQTTLVGGVRGPVTEVIDVIGTLEDA